MRTFSLILTASALSVVSFPWGDEAGAATAPVVLLDGSNPTCGQVLDGASEIRINNPTGGTVSGQGGQRITYTMDGRTQVVSWTVDRGDPVTAVLVRSNSTFEYLYNPPGVTQDTNFIAPGGGQISMLTFCYGVEGTGLGAEPEPQVTIQDLPCPDETFEQRICNDDSVTNDVVAFYFDTTATTGGLATLPVGVCSCDGVLDSTGGENNLATCSFDINADNYCFREDDGTFSNIQAFRGVDAYCTTNEELGATKCSTFCVRGFPGGTSYSCGN